MAVSTVYRLVISPCSSFITRLQSDTIMGHLAWMAAYRNKEDLNALLESCKNGNPPFIVSSGFPHDHLPVPVLKPLTHHEKRLLADEFFSRYGREKGLVMLATCLKKIKNQKFLSMKDWKELKNGLSPYKVAKLLLLEILCCDDHDKIETQTKGPVDIIVVRTAIDRLTGMAADGLLYDHDERYFAHDQSIDIWFRFFDEGMVEKVKTWLEDLSINGFGANASSGAGQFAVKSFEKAENVLPNAEGANGFMSLSHFSPSENDPADGWYSHIVKRGKLGGTFASAGSGNPSFKANVWKYPVVMLVPGSVFKTEGVEFKEHYGRLIEDIHFLYKSVAHFAYSFPLQVKLENNG